MENSADSGSFNIGFRCASGDEDNSAETSRTPLDQETLSQIVAEKGVEGLTEYLAARGKHADVMTPDEAIKALNRRRANIAARAAQAEAAFDGGPQQDEL